MKRDVIYVLVIAVLLALVFRRSPRSSNVVVRQTSDTVVVRDTIRDTVLRKVYSELIRYDTIHFALPADTVFIHAPIPIERTAYSTEDYKAVIEGYKARLVEISVFPKTTIITNTEARTVKKKPRFGLGIQAGYGISNKPGPYLGVGIQYNLITF